MSRRAWIIIIVVLAVVAAALVAVLLVSGGGGVAVPDVSGKTQAEATTALQDAGFVVGDVKQVADQSVPAGSVVSQDPVAGSTADKGSAVALSVSSGPGTSSVPNVTGMDVAAAQGAVSAAGFKPQTAYEYDLKAPAGQVMAQLPAPGEQAYPGADVGLLVSKGMPESTKVPEVTGLTEEAATSALAEAGLKAVPTEAYSDTVAQGLVAGQDPAAGAAVIPLSDVLIEVSLGKGQTTVTVPDLVGLTKSAAGDALKSLGLPAKVAEAYSSSVKAGVVMGQEPAAGVKVEPAATVGVLVSLGPAPSPTPTPSPSATTTSTPKPTPTPSPTKTATPKPTPTPTKTATPTPAPTRTSTPLPTPSPTAWPPVIDPPPDTGVETVTVPDLVGQTVQEAEAELTKLGLEPRVIHEPSVTEAKGVVMKQFPVAETAVPQTYPVFLLVSSGPPAQVNPL
jgi:eukaryotic-like serine/threonine-protein kinase